MYETIRYTLLQVRNPDDPMRSNEVEAFARSLKTTSRMIRVVDLLSRTIDSGLMGSTDMFLLGGSGDYSAAADGVWLERALDSLREVHRSLKPTFASCWGFQAMARAMGGRVVHDPQTAEVGTHRIHLTQHGQRDPVFSQLRGTFLAQMGHEDHVAQLPPGATLLASSEKLANQAYKFNDRPIYCTQFHPELNRQDIRARLSTYPRYAERVAGQSLNDLDQTLQETPEAEALLLRFVALIFGNGASMDSTQDHTQTSDPSPISQK